MSEHLLFGLASIIVLGILAQWLAWRIHLPSILLLLVFGMLAGPALGVLNPDALFGNLLFPLVSVSVAIILFEGGLSLRLDELRQIGRTVRNLITIGIFVTWVLAAIGAHVIANVPWTSAILLGAILVVSGPTVIIPLLRHIRPSGNVGAIVKWEGIVNDPVGAVLAVLVFEAMLSRGMGEGTFQVISGVFQAVFFGLIFGLVGAVVIILLLKRYLIPDFLQNPVSLMVVVTSYVASNALQGESGLLAVTVMGIALANQRYVSIHHIVEFKENLRVLLISSLFVILAARLTGEQLALFNAVNWLFVGFLIIVVRPLAVALSTRGSSLTWKERLFVAWMAPRGIVAAAVASVFAIELTQFGFQSCECLIPLTFQVIIGTVALYGLTAPFLARYLKLSTPDPQGVLFAGAQPWVRSIATLLQEQGFPVVLVDTNWSNITAAHSEGLVAYYADILSENLLHDIHLDGIGRILAMTPNDEVNALSALHFVDIFGRSEVYQLSPVKKSSAERRAFVPQHLRGRYLFDEAATYSSLTGRFRAGAGVKKSHLSEEYGYEQFKEQYGDAALPLFVITNAKKIQVCSADGPPEPKAGDILISIVDNPDAGDETPAEKARHHAEHHGKKRGAP